MSDPVTNNRSIVLPAVGGDSGTWGTVQNNGVFSQLDLILGATQPITITSSDVNLSQAQWNNCAISLTGALTGDHNLVLPLSPNSGSVAVGGLFVVENGTTGAHNVTVLTAASGSTGVVAYQGVRTYLFSDGTNVWYADDAAIHILSVSGNPNGGVAGTAGSVNSPPSVVWDYTNAVLYICTTTGSTSTAVWSSSTSTVLRGFDTAANLKIVATHTGGNLLNIALKSAASGNDPTITSPIIVNFQSLSGANTTGAPTTVNITSALSMNTNATGASFGSVANTPFRIWLAIFNNGGTPVIAMRNCSTAGAIYPLSEYGVASTVSVGAGANAPGVWYTPNGTTLTNCAFRIIGYLEYTTGLTVAGTYTADPNNVVLFGPGIQKAGETVKVSYSAGSATLAISPSSVVNLIKFSASLNTGGISLNTTSVTFNRGGSTLLSQAIGISGSSGSVNGNASAVILDFPATTSSTTYSINSSVGTPNSQAILLEEIMG